eukprot:12766521-Alexandrium_andersonii.AAC.1
MCPYCRSHFVIHRGPDRQYRCAIEELVLEEAVDVEPEQSEATPAVAGGGPAAEPAATESEMKQFAKSRFQDKHRLQSISAAVRVKFRESAKHFRKWVEHDLCIQEKGGDALVKFDRGQVLDLAARGVTPWGGRAVLVPGTYHPERRASLPCEVGAEPTYSEDVLLRDRRSDLILCRVWTAAIQWKLRSDSIARPGHAI